MKLSKIFRRKPRLNDELKIAQTFEQQNIEVVLDIGANRGQTAETLRKNGYRGQIFSIEPLPSLQQELKAKASKDADWHILPPCAIGETEGDCNINVSKAPDMSSLLPANDALMSAYPKTEIMETLTIPMTTLDTLYKNLNFGQKRVLIKIDTQGYEMPILKSGPQALEHAHGLRIEMSLCELYKGETLYTEILAFLSARGFTPHILIDIGYSRNLKRQLQLDGVFYKDQKEP